MDIVSQDYQPHVYVPLDAYGAPGRASGYRRVWLRRGISN